MKLKQIILQLAKTLFLLYYRWKRDENNEIVIGGDGKPVLQFVSVQRRDNGEWALPGVTFSFCVM
jgi:hypothetical protein